MLWTRTFRLFSYLLSMTALSACSASSTYSGDGRLIDNGITAANDRFVVELGYVDLTRPGSKTFRIAGLPKTNFVVGIQVPIAVLHGMDAPAEITSDVSFELVGPVDKRIFSAAGPLRSWTWSGPIHGSSSFVYHRAPSESYFDAAPAEEYQLHVIVRTPDPTMTTKALVLLKSGGWK
jgi:hypothetical protein